MEIQLTASKIYFSFYPQYLHLLSGILNVFDNTSYEKKAQIIVITKKWNMERPLQNFAAENLYRREVCINICDKFLQEIISEKDDEQQLYK